MIRVLATLLGLAVLVPGYSGASEDAAAIVETMQQKEQWRAANSPKYYIVTESYSIGGRSFSLFEKLSNWHGYWHLPPERALELLETPNASESELTALRQLRTQMGLTFMAGALVVNNETQTGNPNDGNLGGTIIGMMEAWIDHRQKLPGELSASQRESRAVRGNLTEFGSKADLHGPIDFYGRSAHYLLARDLGESETLGNDVLPAYRGMTFTIDDIGLWIDTQHYVILGMRFVGRYSNSGENTVSHPFEIQQTLHDYGRVEDSELYLPRRKQMHVRFGPMFGTAAENVRNAENQFDQEINEMRAKRDSGEISDAEYRAFMRRMSTDGLAVLDSFKEALAAIGQGVVGNVEYVRAGESDDLREMFAEALFEAGD